MWDLSVIFSTTNLVTSLLGSIIGIIFGAIPGISTAMTVALFLPFTFAMEPIQAFAFLVAIYVTGAYAGAITAILIRTPGSPASAASVLDGYPMAQQGRAAEAISIATVASFVGGLFGSVILIGLAPHVANIAMLLGPPEFFAVGLFGLSIIASLSTDNFLKGILAACLGVLVSTVGIDPVAGTIRMTFGNRGLIGGVEFVSVLIGFFAFSEILKKIEERRKEADAPKMTVSGKLVSLKTVWSNFFNMIRSCVIGVLVGIVPAVGTGVGSWVSYNEARRAAKDKSNFGKGDPRGIFAAESANNAACGGALIPTLTLGIPGDHITAIMLGAFLIQGLTPGPTLFRDNPEIVMGIYMMFMVSVVFMFILGMLGVRVFAKILDIPLNILMPCVLILCLLGTYSNTMNIIDMRIALIAGVFGYFFQKAKFPIPPIILGLILGPLVEFNFRRALLMSNGDFSIFVTRPISAIFIFIAVMAFISPILSKQYKKYKEARNAKV
ncbi:MAG: tripartite tricarboxylate transporter permease [Defluviitaleaceae bacterium]|nr:tripartite tricarboxylate transporter permease [Defluviitaleaceae bacterium]